MMDLLDSFLSGFQWYRRRRGGVWRLIENRAIPEVSGWYYNQEPHSRETVIETENYD